MQNDNIQRLLSAAKSVKPSGPDAWTCYCPIHESGPGNHNNSLSILASDDGKIVVNCHNGCDAREVIYAFGLTWKDCFPPKAAAASSKITAEYDYHDADGVLRFQVCRIEPGNDGRPKDFRQRQPNGEGGWTWKTKGLQKFPYRLREVAAGSGKPVWIVEGEKQVDYLRSLGMTATCNPGGAGKWLKSYAKFFDGRDCVVVPDCDPPNAKTGKIVGAAHAKEVADSLIGVAKSIHVLELPGCQPKWGLDDWIQKGGHTLEELRDICRTAPAWGPESTLITQVPVDGEPDQEMQEPLQYERKILSDIGLVHCCETDTEAVEVFSSAYRKFSLIRDPGKLTYSRLLQICGPMAAKCVAENSFDGEGKSHSLSSVKNAISLIAGAGKRGNEKLGQGIWRLADKIVMVNGDHIAIYDGKNLTQELSAVHGDHVFELGSCDEWFDFDQVNGWIQQPNRDWILDGLTELCGILKQWCFKIPDKDEDPAICADILASLIVASWIQSFWQFRPMTFLLGESNCGKSTFIQLLIGDESDPLDNGLMGHLAIHSADQSAAGIRQGVERSSRPVIVDELEKSQHRKDILRLFRSASRGSQSIRGSASQTGAVTTKVAFMAWAASTESGISDQADRNRWIMIDMIKPANNRMGKLRLPDMTTLDTLRNKLIAAAVVIGNEARGMVETLMARRPDHIDHRICQIFSVPAAVLACMAGMPHDTAVESFARMLKVFDIEGLERDQDSALDVILTSKIKAHGTDRSLLSLIEQTQSQNRDGSIQNEELLAAHGVKVFDIDKYGNPFDPKFVFMNPRVISRELLRGSNLDGVKIDELILRIPGVSRSQQRINGKSMRGLSIPLIVVLPPDPEEDLFCSTQKENSGTGTVMGQRMGQA